MVSKCQLLWPSLFMITTRLGSLELELEIRDAGHVNDLTRHVWKFMGESRYMLI